MYAVALAHMHMFCRMVGASPGLSLGVACTPCTCMLEVPARPLILIDVDDGNASTLTKLLAELGRSSERNPPPEPSLRVGQVLAQDLGPLG